MKNKTILLSGLLLVSALNVGAQEQTTPRDTLSMERLARAPCRATRTTA